MSIKKEILKINRKALRGVHAFAGFDFEKPCSFEEVETSFTANKINKITSGNDAILLLTTSRSYWEYKFYIVRFNSNALNFEVLRKHQFNYWDFDLDYYFVKYDFEADRKGKFKKCFVIWQASEHVQPKKPDKAIDLNARFKFINKGHHGGFYDTVINNNNQRYVTTIYLQELGAGSEVYEYNKLGMCYTRFDLKTDDPYYYVDKSGYIVNQKREDLQRRAQALRAEREREAAQRADFSELEKMVENHLANTKIVLAEVLVKAETKEKVKKVYYAVNKLWDAYLFWEGYNETKKEKQFRSIASREEKIDAIEKALSSAITEALKAEVK